MKRVLIPIDFSPVSERAIHYAAEIFKGHPMEVFMLYVKNSDQPEPDDEIERKYRDLTFGLLKGSGFDYDFFIREGDLIEEIKSATETFNIHLVIMGTRGEAGDGLFTNSAMVMKAANTPVIIVPEDMGKGQIRRIAYANDFQNVNDPSVFKTLWDIARTFDSEVHVVHINQNNEAVDNEEQIIEYYLEYIDHEYVCISNPDIEKALGDYISEKKIDLLVVLPRRKTMQLDSGERSLVKNLTEHAAIPVLTLT